jgi:hypothetical protein
LSGCAGKLGTPRDLSGSKTCKAPLGADWDRVQETVRTRQGYRHVLCTLRDARIAYLVGGAYAFDRHTGIGRETKDLDLFVRERDVERALDVLEAKDCRVQHAHPHWLAKATCDGEVVDIIHNSGNGVCAVDDEWFEHAVKSEALEVPVWLVPVEELIWSKSFVMERERYDGADVLHLLRARGNALDWERLLRRYDRHYRVLYSFLVLFGFVYPSERDAIPSFVMTDLARRIEREQDMPPGPHVCQGTLLSRAQFLVDVERFGFDDARAAPDVHMTDEQIAHWTQAITQKGTHDGDADDDTAGSSR